MIPIDWRRLSLAVEFYEDIGYTRVEVPWLVRPDITDVTLPPGARPFTLTMGLDPVGSAEQGFIQLMEEGNLPPGRYVTLTPCFRHDTTDDLHQLWFMKVELIEVEPEDASESCDRMLEDAKRFFSYYVEIATVDIVDSTSNQVDIVARYDGIPDIELGSYGIRTWKGHTWVYGTGCAEPRLATAIDILGCG